MDPAPAFLDAHGTIHPLTWGQWKEKQPDRSLVECWFRHSDPRQVGILLLAGSDAHPRSQDTTCLQILDLESATVAEAFREELNFAGHADLLYRCVIEWTPSGSAHLGFRCAAISDRPPLKLAQRPRDPANPTAKTLLIELLQHQPCTVAPTQVQCKQEHPAGVCYTLTQGTWAHPYVISPAQRQILLDTARLFNEVPEVVKPDRSEVVRDGSRPGDKLNAAATVEWWQNLLTTHGWRDVSRRTLIGKGVYYFQRPGKTGYQTSATYGKTGQCLYVFSENAHPFEGKTAYSPFAAYAVLEHQGDYTAAATALAKVYPPTAEERRAYLGRMRQEEASGPPSSPMRTWLRRSKAAPTIFTPILVQEAPPCR